MPDPGRLVACRWKEGMWYPAAWNTLRHFVAAKPLDNPLAEPLVFHPAERLQRADARILPGYTTVMNLDELVQLKDYVIDES